MTGLTGELASKVEINVTCYHNCDDVELFWRTRVDGQDDSPIPECLGFMLQRQRKQEDGTWGPIEILRNRVGFIQQESPLTYSISQPGNIWPFQTYNWTEHGANSGQNVRYRISAVRLPSGGVAGTTKMETFADSDWTDPIDVSAKCGNGLSAFFNRGFVMSQFVSRIMRQNNWKPTDLKEQIKNLEEPLRIFLSGDLRVAIINLLDEVSSNPDLSLYAALYELSDLELISKLVNLSSRAHIVLANGSDKQGDGNKCARCHLKDAGVDVKDRILGKKGLGHNKFAVVVQSADNQAIKAWTGSTNWAATGLCTQVNNGILIQDPAVAAIYLNQWQRLADANSDFTPVLVESNANSPYTTNNIDIWFTPIRKPRKTYTSPGADIQELIKQVKSAREMILYVMFQPGQEPLTTILSMAPDVYVRGVASTVTTNLEETFEITGIELGSKSYTTALIQPQGIKEGFSYWIGEVTRNQFLYPPENPGVGHAITHSKMIVIDPLSEKNCKVITGSHNFSKSASENNDENFIIIRGNKGLAEAYSVACLATYSHYRWRAYVKDQIEAGKEVWQHLLDNPDWQSQVLTTDFKNHLSKWCKWPNHIE
jgi:hypothetical protein